MVGDHDLGASALRWKFSEECNVSLPSFEPGGWSACGQPMDGVVLRNCTVLQQCLLHRLNRIKSMVQLISLSFLFPLVVFAFSFPLLALQYVSLPFPFQILLTYHSIRKVHDTGQVDGATSV